MIKNKKEMDSATRKETYNIVKRTEDHTARKIEEEKSLYFVGKSNK